MIITKASDVRPHEYHPYYSSYITKLEDTELINGLKHNLTEYSSFLESIPEGKFAFAYESGKWTIKDVIQHVIDAERIFAYRALCFARGEKQNLPGFEQDDYIKTANTEAKSNISLVEEYVAVRNASIALFSNFTEDALKIVGKASGSDMSTRAAGFLIIGHERHHMGVIKDVYL